MLPSINSHPNPSDGLVVDLFAGGGGASEGLALALGRDPDIAINHDPEALAMHKANHPGTKHLLNDITRVLPLEATGGQRVAILHASPDCTHFSKAKGAKPRTQFIRDLAWTVVRWAEETLPTLITLENVEEFLTWGPLDQSGYPIKEHAGDTFRAWVKRLRRLGYKVAWRLLRACDYGAPTTRRRLFVVARRDGISPVWPKPTHGAPHSPAVLSGKLLPWRTAAECIDWTIQSQSIFDRKKPLAVNTQRRIAEGIRRYVINAAEPFLVTYYGPKKADDFRGQNLSRPLPTQTTENRFGLVSPVISGCVINPNHVAKNYTPFRGQSIQEPLRAITKAPGFALASAHASPFIQHVQHSKASGGVMPADEPLRTITAQPKGGGLAVVAPMLSRQFGQSIGQRVDQPHPTITQCNHDALISACVASAYLVGAGGPAYAGKPAAFDKPIRTILPENHRALAMVNMIKMRGQNIGSPADEPLRTISAQGQHHALLSCLVKYYGNEQGGVPVTSPLHTITGHDRMGLVTVKADSAPSRYEQVRDWLRLWAVIGPDEDAEITHDGIVYRLTDICMRMLAPRELYTAQGFGPDYQISPDINGKPLSKTAQVRMCGNSVPPQFVAALVGANGPETWKRQPKQIEYPLLAMCKNRTGDSRMTSLQVVRMYSQATIKAEMRG